MIFVPEIDFEKLAAMVHLCGAFLNNYTFQTIHLLSTRSAVSSGLLVVCYVQG